jgi:glyoxylase-like metal-dependent hydrolase (beta-lactamase superfamily II)
MAIPEAARWDPIDPAKGYLVEEIGDNLFWISDGPYQAMFAVEREGVILVDAPPSLGGRLHEAIAEVTDRPVTHVVYTHEHADHAGGASLFDGAVFVSHRETALLLERAGDPRRPVPTVTFDDELSLGQLVLRYHGLNHQPGNLFVHAPRQRTLMVVDVVYHGWAPYRSLGLPADVHGFIDAHDTMLGYEFEHFVSGHNGRLGTRHDVEEAREHVHDLHAACARALDEITILDAIREVGVEDSYLMMGTFHQRVSERAAAEVIEKWRDRLGGVEQFTADNCWVMSQCLRLDEGYAMPVRPAAP